MNGTYKLSEMKNRYYIYYQKNNEVALLKKNNETQLTGSLERLKKNGINAYLVVDMQTFETISYNYTEIEDFQNIEEPYMSIVKTKDDYIGFYNMDGTKPYYDFVVRLSCGSFILVNRKNQTFVKHI